MKASMKAALWSALVFPGTGQMYLKRYVRGLSLMVVALTGLGVLIAQAVTVALRVLDTIQLQGGPLDINAITNRVAASSTASGEWYSPLIVPMIVVCWIYSVIDAYLLGKKKDGAAVQKSE
jgi:TM2 domain-containing membrane protein YozV